MDNYNNEINQIKENINSVTQVAELFNISCIVDKVDIFEERLKNDKFSITMVGEFNMEKSTFINALL